MSLKGPFLKSQLTRPRCAWFPRSAGFLKLSHSTHKHNIRKSREKEDTAANWLAIRQRPVSPKRLSHPETEFNFLTICGLTKGYGGPTFSDVGFTRSWQLLFQHTLHYLINHLSPLCSVILFRGLVSCCCCYTVVEICPPVLITQCGYMWNFKMFLSL